MIIFCKNVKTKTLQVITVLLTKDETVKTTQNTPKLKNKNT